MENEKNLNWLNSLKVGNEVGIIEEIERLRNTVNYSSAKVSEIKDDGEIVLSTGTVFDQKGEYFYEEHLGTIFRYKMVPLTDAIKKKSRFYKINKMIGLITGGPL